MLQYRNHNIDNIIITIIQYYRSNLIKKFTIFSFKCIFRVRDTHIIYTDIIFNLEFPRIHRLSSRLAPLKINRLSNQTTVFIFFRYRLINLLVRAVSYPSPSMYVRAHTFLTRNESCGTVGTPGTRGSAVNPATAGRRIVVS